MLAEKAAKAAPAPPPAAPSKPAVPKPQGGKAPIYIGYSKSDSDLRKTGAPGRFILDDPTKYPAKEDVGFFCGCLRGGSGTCFSVVGWSAGVPRAALPGGARPLLSTSRLAFA